MLIFSFKMAHYTEADTFCSVAHLLSYRNNLWRHHYHFFLVGFPHLTTQPLPIRFLLSHVFSLLLTECLLNRERRWGNVCVVWFNKTGSCAIDTIFFMPLKIDKSSSYKFIHCMKEEKKNRDLLIAIINLFLFYGIFPYGFKIQHRMKFYGDCTWVTLIIMVELCIIIMVIGYAT